MDNHQPPPSQPLASSRMGLRGAGGGGGEIVEVQGGHIVRSTGRKDRHSKVCTAKGPRDRRVRLSAHTAIQFYDVQDRLGYDRPSKAVDWLINKAKAAIDELAVLPPWHLTAAPGGGGQVHKTDDSEEPDHPAENSVGPGKKPVEVDEPPVHTGYEPRFMSPQGMDSDAAIADTMKSFFPMVAATTSSSNPFQSYSPDLLSRTSSAQAQDLRLSLQSFQDPILLHHNSAQASEQSLFSVSAGPLSFDAGPSSSWSEHQQEMSRYWASPAGGGGGFFFSSGLQPVMAAAPMLGHGQSQVQLFTQRGPLQSSNSPQVRAWADSAAMSEHPLPPMSPHSSSVIGFNSGGFSGFRVPARIYGEEEHDPVGNKPSAGSSASRH